MLLLIAGLLLWTVIHFIPTLGRKVRTQAIASLGALGYKVVFAILMLASLKLVLLGWDMTSPTHLYMLPAVLKPVILGLIAVSFILFSAPYYPTRIKRVLRHPQLVGMALFCATHIALNGDVRSITVFGWLGAWAIVEILLIKRRDKEWVKPQAPNWGIEIIGLMVSLAAFAGVAYYHL